MKMHRLVALLVVGSAFGSELASGQVPSGDLARLQGRWWTKVVMPGSNVALINAIEVTGDRVTTSEVKQSRDKTAQAELALQSTGQIKLNESSSPRTIDFVNTKASNAQLGEVNFPDFYGIYEIDGDTVKFCINNGIVTKTRPRAFQANPRGGIGLTTWTRAEPSAEVPKPAMAKGKPTAPKAVEKPAKVEKLETVRGVTVVGIADRTISFKTADGQVFTTGTAIRQAFDLQGAKLDRGLDVMVGGNVVDLTIFYADKAGQPNQIREVRLVQGETGHVVLQNNVPMAKGKGHVTYLKTPAGPGESYQGAIITMVDKKKLTVSVDGKAVEMSLPHAAMVALDLQGNRLRSPGEHKLLVVGNKVDIVLKPRSPDPRFLPHVESMRLVEGRLADQ